MKKQRRQNMHFYKKKYHAIAKREEKTQQRTLCKYTCGTVIYTIIPSYLIKDCQ